MSAQPLARRAFLAALSGVLAALVGGVRETPRVATSGIASAEAATPSATDDDSWHVDDMWGHRPRYAHPIPHAGAALDPVLWDHVDPIDRPFML
jgi:hypothetical protein